MIRRYRRRSSIMMRPSPLSLRWALRTLVGYPYAHQNTDHAMKWRADHGRECAGAHDAVHDPVWRALYPERHALSADCHREPPLLFVANITRSTVDIKCISSLALGLVVDFGLTTTGSGRDEALRNQRALPGGASRLRVFPRNVT